MDSPEKELFILNGTDSKQETKTNLKGIMNSIADLRIAGLIQGILSVLLVIICQIMLQIFKGDIAWMIIHYLIPLSPFVAMLISLLALKPIIERNQINNIDKDVKAKFKKIYASLVLEEDQIMKQIASCNSQAAKQIYQDQLLDVVSQRRELKKQEREMLKREFGINSPLIPRTST